MTPSGQQSAADLLVGDYLRVAGLRVTASVRGVDEGFARVERVEHLSEDLARGRFAHHNLGFGPVPVVWCHGVPGPVVLRPGTVPVLDEINPGRARHDEGRPWWRPSSTVLLRGAVVEGDRPHLQRREPVQRGWWDWADATSGQRSQHRATAFTKPASALLVGDYLRIQSARWPEHDHDVDEGFARVEHLRLVDPDPAEILIADTAWHTTLLVVGVHGLPGVLVVRATDEVTVQAWVNPEQDAFDRRDPWSTTPLLVLRGSRERTGHEQRAARAVDAAHRPRVNEADWYPSIYRDPFHRRLLLDGRRDVRMVPLSALPWPHGQDDCPMGHIAAAHRSPVLNEQAAHAAAFLSAEGRQAFRTCPYHQPDWPRLIAILVDCLREGRIDQEALRQHPDYQRLTGGDQNWVDSYAYDQVDWDDRDPTLTGGQHRLCAFRAAGVSQCPVYGNHLNTPDYGPSIPAEDHARRTITTAWRTYAARRGWPAWLGTILSTLPPSIAARLIARTTSNG